MRKYRMLPVVVEAMQWFGSLDDVELLWTWMSLYGDQQYFFGHKEKYYMTVDNENIEIEINDYIIRGQNGKFYPCKPNIFWKTYEEVDNEKYHEI